MVDFTDHTFVLRQSMAVHWETPFLYLFCGNDRALLLDTGADPELFPLRAIVDRLLDGWLAEHPRDTYELIVAHTHGHGDHIAGDPQFADRPHTTVVPADLASVRSFFGINDWPDDIVWTGFLLTGDSVIPGRLYVDDFPAFQRSLDRLVEFTEPRRSRM